MTFFRSALTVLFRRIVGVYFREIEILGEAPSKAVGGRLFVSNHVNAIIDPILVLTTARCEISPVAKTTLWKVPGFRSLLNAVDAVPIARRVDDPKKTGGSNDKVFEHVARWLNRGGNILIFPEGTSHNEPHLTPLKTGAARMLLQAVSGAEAPRLTFQSVALEFDDREKFRSRVLLIYGPVRNVSDYVEGAPQPKPNIAAPSPIAQSTGSAQSPAVATTLVAALSPIASTDGIVAPPVAPPPNETFIEKITEQIRADLSELLVEGATWDERRLITRVAEMLANEAGERTLGSFNEIGRKVEASRKMLGGDVKTYQTIQRAVSDYYGQLHALGLKDEDICHKKTLKMASLVSGLLLLFSAPFAAIGMLLYAPPYWIIFLIASRIKSRDETSTIKLGLGLVLYPLWFFSLIVAIALWARSPWNWACLAMCVVTPAIAIYWLDKTPGMKRALRVFLPRKGLTRATLGRETAMALIKKTQQTLGL